MATNIERKVTVNRYGDLYVREERTGRSGITIGKTVEKLQQMPWWCNGTYRDSTKRMKHFISLVQDLCDGRPL